MPTRKVLERAARDKQEGSTDDPGGRIHSRGVPPHSRRASTVPDRRSRPSLLASQRRAVPGWRSSLGAQRDASQSTREKDERDFERGHGKMPARGATPCRRAATTRALNREGDASGSPAAIARQSRRAASRRSKAHRSAAAKRAARTRGPRRRSVAAKRATQSWRPARA